ncbi:hypothetical protein ADEAN_000387400 [Angomonas deanei]|uniref:Uncharacterized protein n=1 Tax=Angomonas deanei TaxID=59799 RepID=A0A7G2CE36_9TRYP|nr:hypothetical protein ADEAN_000387400 [Angomonas deanei]
MSEERQKSDSDHCSQDKVEETPQPTSCDPHSEHAPHGDKRCCRGAQRCCCSPHCTCCRPSHPGETRRSEKTEEYAPYRKCVYCLPERNALREAELLKKQFAYQQKKKEQCEKQYGLLHYCGPNDTYHRNTSELLRSCKGNYYQNSAREELNLRRRELQDELKARRGEIMMLARMKEPLSRPAPESERRTYSTGGCKGVRSHHCGCHHGRISPPREWEGRRGCGGRRGRSEGRHPHRHGHHGHCSHGRRSPSPHSRCASWEGRHGCRPCGGRSRSPCSSEGRRPHHHHHHPFHPPPHHWGHPVPPFAHPHRHWGPERREETPLCPSCRHPLLKREASEVVKLLASNEHYKWCQCPACGFVAGRMPPSNEPTDSAPVEDNATEKKPDTTPKTSTSGLASPSFGRKVFITDDVYLNRRAQLFSSWEEAGMVEPLPRKRSPSAPLPEQTPKWKTVQEK